MIGTAVRGPAFVPVTVATFQDFVAKFGNTDAEKFGPLAMREWFENAGAGTYVRVLGVGDGKTRTTSGNNQGKVTNAGFVVGDQQVKANGNVGANPYAFAVGTQSDHDGLGRTYFLGAFMSQSAGSTIFEDSGIGFANTAHPIIRGVLMAPSGVILSLSCSFMSASDGDWTPRNEVTTLNGLSGTFGVKYLSLIHI